MDHFLGIRRHDAAGARQARARRHRGGNVHCLFQNFFFNLLIWSNILLFFYFSV